MDHSICIPIALKASLPAPAGEPHGAKCQEALLLHPKHCPRLCTRLSSKRDNIPALQLQLPAGRDRAATAGAAPCRGGAAMGLAEFAGWLATQVFDVVGSFAGVQGADCGAAVDLQVGKTVFHDVPKQMRSELWLSQLQRKGPQGGAPTQGDFYDLLFEASKLPPEVLSDIDKDTHRTFPGHPRLSTPEGHKALLNVLSAYALSDPEIGYTQGMNFLAGVLLTWLPSEADAFAALSLLMRQRGLREMYLPDMSLLQVRLWQLSKLLPPRLGAHLEAHAVLPVLYASSWLLTCFAADFPLHFAGRVMDVLLTQGHQVASPVLKVAVAIVHRCEADLLRMTDFEDMVYYLRQEVPQWSKTQLQELLTDALSKPWTARQLRVLDQINGAETVMEAVSRVNKLVTMPTPEAAEVAAALDSAASSTAPAPAAAAPPAARVFAGGSSRPQQQQQQSQQARQGGQQAQLSPRTFAKSLSSGFAPGMLPPPPAARGSKPAASAHAASGKPEPPAWQAFASAELQTLAELETQKVRIDKSVADDLDLLDLDPQLSQALSCYAQPGAPPGASAGSGAAAAAALPAAGGQPLPAAAAACAGAGAAPLQRTAAQAASGASEAGGGAEAEARHARWDAFARDASRTLQAAVPSPFESRSVARSSTMDPRLLMQQHPAAAGSAGSSTALPAPANSTPAVPAPQSAVAAEAAAAQQGSADASAEPPPAAALSYGSFQLGTLTSAAPLVDAPGGSAGSAAPSPMHAFLNLFRKSDGSQRATSASGDDAASSDLRDAPSSTGSSLAAVLQQLGLSEAGSGAAGSLSGAAATGADRRLRHSSELDDFGSFKTAAGPPSHGGPPSELSDASWHSAAAGELQRQSTGLSSTASSGFPAPAAGGIAPAAGSSAWAAAGSSGAEPAAPARSASPALLDRQRGLRLSSDEANLRAASLQEQALVGFLESGKKDAAAAAAQQQQSVQQSAQQR
ncbi:hypothetical protein ABPG75_005922 [Micractinium tetrahymenae]